MLGACLRMADEGGGGAQPNTLVCGLERSVGERAGRKEAGAGPGPRSSPETRPAKEGARRLPSRETGAREGVRVSGSGRWTFSPARGPSHPHLALRHTGHTFLPGWPLPRLLSSGSYPLLR